MRMPNYNFNLEVTINCIKIKALTVVRNSFGPWSDVSHSVAQGRLHTLGMYMYVGRVLN